MKAWGGTGDPLDARQVRGRQVSVLLLAIPGHPEPHRRPDPQLLHMTPALRPRDQRGRSEPTTGTDTWRRWSPCGRLMAIMSGRRRHRPGWRAHRDIAQCHFWVCAGAANTMIASGGCGAERRAPHRPLPVCVEEVVPEDQGHDVRRHRTGQVHEGADKVE